MPPIKLELGIEELAYAMGVLGGTDTAIGFLLALLGERPRLETEGRLLAASHALVARGLLDFDAQTGDKWLAEDLRLLVEPMLHNDFSLRCSWAKEGREDVLTLYAAAAEVLMHRLHRAVVSHLQRLSDWDVARQQLSMFLDLPRSGEEESFEPLATFSADLIDTLRKEAPNRSRQEIAAQLQTQGVPDGAATKLAADLQQHEYRGSIIKITGQNDHVVANQGFLILKTEKRSWFLVIHPDDEPMLTLYPGSPTLFERLFTSLVS